MICEDETSRARAQSWPMPYEFREYDLVDPQMKAVLTHEDDRQLWRLEISPVNSMDLTFSWEGEDLAVVASLLARAEDFRCEIGEGASRQRVSRHGKFFHANPLEHPPGTVLNHSDGELPLLPGGPGTILPVPLSQRVARDLWSISQGGSMANPDEYLKPSGLSSLQDQLHARRRVQRS